MSSFDSYEIAVPINDDVYMQQLNDYRMSVEDSDSCSGSDGDYKKITYPEAVHRLEKYLVSNELDVLHDYICCKKQVFDRAANDEQFKYNALNIHSFIATVAVAFLPWFQNTRAAISVLSAFILFLQHWIHYSKCGTLASAYANKSQSYSRLLAYLSNGKYASNTTVLKNMETRLECLDQKLPANYVKKFPLLSSINIFALFKHVESSRNSQIRKYIHAENKLSKAKANGTPVDVELQNKIAKIKENLSKLNYDKLKEQLVKEQL